MNLTMKVTQNVVNPINTPLIKEERIMNLLHQTKILMRYANTKEARKICKKVGASLRWWHKVKSGGIKEPGIMKIQAIYDELSKHIYSSLDSSHDQGKVVPIKIKVNNRDR